MHLEYLVATLDVLLALVATPGRSKHMCLAQEVPLLENLVAILVPVGR